MTETLKRTVLYDWHVAHGGRMVPFAGWEMPVQYPTGPLEEHHVTRRAVGLFDIDHMGQFTLSGPQAESYLNHLLTWNVSLMKPHEAHYACMCYENGTVIDDVFVYRFPQHWVIVVNADNLVKDYAWMQQQAAGYEVTLTDVSADTYMLALQGPQAIPLLQHLIDADVTHMPRFTALVGDILGVPTWVGRTGYTGEDGVELFFPASSALTMWEGLLQGGADKGIEIKPIGLAARDSLRFEPGYALYGHELSDTITPIEAGLIWVCRFDHDFIGRDVLWQQKEQGVSRKLISFELTEKAVPRPDYPVAAVTGEEIGTVVTGMYAPTLNKYCGNAYVAAPYAEIGTPLQIIIRNKPKAAVVVKRPMYKPAYR